MALDKQDLKEIKKIVDDAIKRSEIKMPTKARCDESNGHTNNSWSDFRREMNEHKSFALEHFEKWGHTDVEKLAKKLRFQKEGGKWTPIENI